MDFLKQVAIGVFFGVVLTGGVLLFGLILLKIRGMKMFRDPEPHYSRGLEFGRHEEEKDE